jgi:hypothetical protein
MITTSATWDLILWLLFWSIVAWALWWGVQDLRKWLKRNANGCAGNRDFPDEARGEAGTQESAADGSLPHR